MTHNFVTHTRHFSGFLMWNCGGRMFFYTLALLFLLIWLDLLNKFCSFILKKKNSTSKYTKRERILLKDIQT